MEFYYQFSVGTLNNFPKPSKYPVNVILVPQCTVIDLTTFPAGLQTRVRTTWPWWMPTTTRGDPARVRYGSVTTPSGCGGANVSIGTRGRRSGRRTAVLSSGGPPTRQRTAG